MITTPRTLAQTIHLARSFGRSIQVRHFLTWVGLLRWVWLLQWVGLTQAGSVFTTYSVLETAQNARTLRASLPMCAQPARQTIRDLLVQKHREYRQTQVEGVECPSTSGFVIVVGTQASGTRHVVIVNQYHTVVIFTCLCTYLLG